MRKKLLATRQLLQALLGYQSFQVTFQYPLIPSTRSSQKLMHFNRLIWFKQTTRMFYI
jgi:hypothetical protein